MAIVITGAGGVSWYTGAGAPAAGLGQDGDLYLDTVAGNVYQNSAGTWAVISTVAGAGATWYSGKGTPSSSLGNNGDYYLQTNNGAIWTKAAGAWVKVSTVNTTSSTGDNWTTVLKTADESVTNSIALQNDDELFFTTINGGAYRVELALVYASPVGGTAPDIKFASGEDANTRGTWMTTGNSTGDAGQTSGNQHNQSTTVSFGTATQNRVVWASGVYYAGGGTFRILWAQNTANANPTIVRAGSYLRYIKVA